MYFEIVASRGKQMVSKEGLKNWHQFLGLNLCFWGTQFFGFPIVIEPCFGTATEMAPIGSKNGALWRAHFWNLWGPFLWPFRNKVQWNWGAKKLGRPKTQIETQNWCQFLSPSFDTICLPRVSKYINPAC